MVLGMYPVVVAATDSRRTGTLSPTIFSTFKVYRPVKVRPSTDTCPTHYKIFAVPRSAISPVDGCPDGRFCHVVVVVISRQDGCDAGITNPQAPLTDSRCSSDEIGIAAEYTDDDCSCT